MPTNLYYWPGRHTATWNLTAGAAELTWRTDTMYAWRETEPVAWIWWKMQHQSTKWSQPRMPENSVLTVAEEPKRKPCKRLYIVFRWWYTGSTVRSISRGKTWYLSGKPYEFHTLVNRTCSDTCRCHTTICGLSVIYASPFKTLPTAGPSNTDWRRASAKSWDVGLGYPLLPRNLSLQPAPSKRGR